MRANTIRESLREDLHSGISALTIGGPSILGNHAETLPMGHTSQILYSWQNTNCG